MDDWVNECVLLVGPQHPPPALSLSGWGFTIMANNEINRQQRGQKEDPIYPEQSINEYILEFSPPFPQQHDHSKIQLGNAQEVAPFPLGQQWMSEDLIQTSVVTGCCMFLCGVLHPLTIIRVFLCLWERPPPYLFSTWVFSEYFGFTTPIQSDSQRRLSKKWQPPPLCTPCIGWNLTFFTHTSFFLSHSVFHFSRSSSWVLLWFCPAFCSKISHTRLDKHTLSCCETHNCWLTGSRCF